MSTPLLPVVNRNSNYVFPCNSVTNCLSSLDIFLRRKSFPLHALNSHRRRVIVVFSFLTYAIDEVIALILWALQAK